MKQLRITVDGKTYEVDVEIIGEAAESAAPARGAVRRSASVATPVAAAKSAVAAPAVDGAVTSPLAAVVVSVDVQPGQQVKEGDKLITLEAMKMNTIVSSPAAGTVGTIHIKAGDAVEEGQALVSLS